MTELQAIERLETVSKLFTKTIEGQQELVALVPNIGADEIISSALFSTKVTLDVE
jgi:hypothetical protein